MDSIRDYIAWLGDFDFDALPVREADALVLCAISYFDLSPAMDADGAPFYLKDCIPNIESGELQIRITGGEQGLTGVLLDAAKSNRFGNLLISRYVDRFEPEKDLQFAAVTFSFKDKFSFIAYRGTDNTLVGWKEDFMIAYTKTEAQRLALEYAEEGIAADKPGLFERIFGSKKASKEWYIAGHSKGGNLAMFAAAGLSDTALSRLVRVFILDGPGSSSEVLSPESLDRIDSKAIRIIPEYSVVGRLMEAKFSDTKVVKSSNDGAMQHAIGSWGIEHGGLALAEDQTPKDRWINRTLRDWIEGLPYDKREVFVNEFFDALAAGGAETLGDVLHGGREGYDAIIRKAIGFSEPTRQVISELRTAAFESAKEQIGQARQQVASRVPSAGDIIGGAKKALGFVTQEFGIKDSSDN